MANILITALLGSPVIAGSGLGISLAQDSKPTVKPCVGGLCAPTSPREDMPDQKTMGSKQGKPMQGQDQSSGQLSPRKKKRISNKQAYSAMPYRTSCREGRAIVAQRFNRVRVIECGGWIYTYRGRGNGETFRIRFNSRSGRIVGRS